MFQADPQNDPIIEILRLAYRRGFAIQREQAREIKEAGNPDGDERCADTNDTVDSEIASTSQQKI
jgi:hypothetical protein